MLTDFARPAPDLSEIVAGFRQRTSGHGERAVILPLPARAELFAEFYFATPYRARAAVMPDTILVGPSTAYHTDIELGGTIDTFTVKFHPTALHRLFGLPGALLVDRAEEATAVHAGFAELRDRLGQAGDFRERVMIAQGWLRGRLAPARAATSIDRAARLIRRSAGRIDIDRLARDCAMTTRSFRHHFSDAVGLAPKLYSRIARFNAVLDRKDRDRDQSWTRIAQQLDYFDQSHMLRDFREFAHRMPIAGRNRMRAR